MNDIDSQLWHACAGGVTQMPLANSKAYYFPQGHAEHAQSPVDFSTCLRRIPPLILCRISSVKYRAEASTDEVFSIIRMTPLMSNETDYCEEDGLSLGDNGSQLQDKLASFAKILTQSDANNGGGFSVPRYCAETIFPSLDYKSEPPVQTVLVKDVHGKIWNFRHIYRGTPRRHLLTSGWSNFVNEKKLVAGDTVVFLKTKNDHVCVGIRRTKRGVGGVPESPAGWNHSAESCMYRGFSGFLREEESKLIGQNSNGGGSISSGSNMMGWGKVKADSVIEAAILAASGKPFEVVYYPRANALEFCVKASAVGTAMRIQWCSGMRIKMALEDSSKISFFMGTISSVVDSDPIWWPGSPWRLLQVSWDDSSILLQNVNSVSPWLVEPILNMPAIHFAPFSPTRKMPQNTQHPGFPLDFHLLAPTFPGNPPIPGGSPSCCLPTDINVAGIQGARQSQYGISLPELRIGELQSSLFHAQFHQLDRFHPHSRISAGPIVPNFTIHEDVVSSLSTIGNPPKFVNKESDMECNAPKKTHFMLFGTPILAEQHLSLNTYSNLSNGSGSATSYQNAMVDTNSSSELLLHCNLDKKAEDIGHCKVFMESENVGRILDLSAFGSYEQLYRRLANMFAIENSELSSRILYRDTAGAVKHTEEEPFAEFRKVARRLTILMDSSSDDSGKL